MLHNGLGQRAMGSARESKAWSLPPRCFQGAEEARHLRPLLSGLAVDLGYYKAGKPVSHGSISKTLGETGYHAHFTDEQNKA